MTELPDGWASAQIGELSSKIGSGATPRGGEKAYKASGIPLLRSLNVHFDGVRDAGLAFIDDDQARKLDNATVSSGDVLLNITGASIGRVAIAPNRFEGARVNQHVCIIRVAEGTEAEFVARFLASPNSQRIIRDENYGVTRQALTKGMIEEFSIPLPPLPEQQRIVRKLDTLSARTTAARTHLTAIGSLIERYKVSVLRMAFDGSLSADYRAEQADQRAVEFELTPSELKKLKLASLRLSVEKAPYQVPGTWRWIALPALGELARGKSKHRPRNDKALFGGPYPFIQTGDVSNSGGRIEEYSSTYSEFGLSQSRLWPVGTLCITIAANIAETGILGFESCFPDSVVGFIADEEKTSELFVEYFVRTVRADLEAFAPGVAQKNINLSTLSGVFVPTPPVDEQREIVRRIEAAFGKIDRLATEAEKALKLSDRLDERILAKAFAGELVPQNPNDEPASALLERIRGARANSPKKPRPRRTKATAMKKDPKDLLLDDSAKWPANGITSEELADRVVIPHEDLRDALFELLSGAEPQLEQVFDKAEERMRLKRVAQ